MHNLKLATEEDWPEVLRMARAFHAASPYSSIPFSESKVRSIFDVYIVSPTDVIVILLQVNEKVVGVIVGIISDIYFADIKTAGEIIWWVDPEYRRTKGSIKLFEAFEYWGWKMGAKFLNATNTAGTAELSRFYERQGFHLCESTYLKEINNARI